MSRSISKDERNTHLTVCLHLVERTSKLSPVPWGARERVPGNWYERFWTQDLYCLTSDGKWQALWTKEEPPAHLRRGVSVQ